MTVYKYFLRAALRQKWIIIGYTVIFLILAILNGSSTETENVAFAEKSLELGVVDQSRSELSKALIAYLEDNNLVIMMEKDKENIKEQIFLEALNAVIIIPKDFESLVRKKEAGIEIFKDDRKMGPLQLENQINKFLTFANSQGEFNSLNLSRVKMVMDDQVEVKLVSENSMIKNKGANDWFKSYFNFTGYIIIAIYVAVIGYVMVEFNDKKNQDRMKVSSKKFLNLNIEVYLGQVTLGIIISSIIILGSLLIKGKHLGEINFLKYVINTFIFSFAILCFTFLINNVTKSKFVINGISTVASLGTAFISGVLIPQEFISKEVLTIAKFFPTYYFVKINETSINSFLDVKYEIFMQSLFGISFLLLGLYFSKIKRKN